MDGLFRLEVYREEDGGWYFDDPSRGLVREALVCGADEVLDRAAAVFVRVAAIPGVGELRRDRLRVAFTDSADAARMETDRSIFSSVLCVPLTMKDGPEVDGTAGTWYDAGEADELLRPTFTNGVWLCPALLRYFPTPPSKLYVFVAPVWLRNP